MALNESNQAHSEMVTALESPASTIADVMRMDSEVHNHFTSRLLHAAMGCVTESGELMDQMKKHIVYNKPLDVVNVMEELGDILWYIQLACNVTGYTMEQLLLQNMEKLRVRFGDRFDFDKVLNRDLAAERQALENHA